MNFTYKVVPIEQVSLNPANARLHSPKNLEYLKNSLKEFGFQKPITVSKDFIIYAGEGRYLAAKELGFKEIPIAISELSIDKLKAYAIADNQTALTSTWDLSKLSEELKDLALVNENTNWTALGFEENELKLMLSFDKDFKPIADEDNFKQPLQNNTVGNNSGEEKKEKYKPLKVNSEQLEIIQLAIEKLRTLENDKTIPDGRAIELICAAYLA